MEHAPAPVFFLFFHPNEIDYAVGSHRELRSTSRLRDRERLRVAPTGISGKGENQLALEVVAVLQPAHANAGPREIEASAEATLGAAVDRHPGLVAHRESAVGMIDGFPEERSRRKRASAVSRNREGQRRLRHQMTQAVTGNAEAEKLSLETERERQVGGHGGRPLERAECDLLPAPASSTVARGPRSESESAAVVPRAVLGPGDDAVGGIGVDGDVRLEDR